MIRTFLIGALIAFVLACFLTLRIMIFAPPTMTVFGLALVLCIVGAMLPTDLPKRLARKLLRRAAQGAGREEAGELTCPPI